MKGHKLKTRNVGGLAFHDYNWTCPTCGGDNREFQLPPLDGREGWTLTELEQACSYCSNEAKWVGTCRGIEGGNDRASTGAEYLARHGK